LFALQESLSRAAVSKSPQARSVSAHGGADRRPWLILSRTEAVALRAAVQRSQRDSEPVALRRALEQIDLQLAYIDHGRGEEPSKYAAYLREMGQVVD